MAQQTIGIGAAPNDGTGDTIRDAFDKCNDNFTEIYNVYAATQINDSNGNELLKFTATASAVNELTLANAATGNNPTFTASGGDSNIGARFAQKGTGTFIVKYDNSAAQYGKAQSWYGRDGGGSSVENAYMREDGMLRLGIYGLQTDLIATTGGTTWAGYDILAGVTGGYMTSLKVTGPTAFTTPQTLSGAGAVNLTTTVTKYTSTGGAEALTLADGTDGQIKIIVHAVDGGSGVLTPTTKTGYTTITFTNAGETAILQFFTTIGWCILSLRGAVAA